MRLRQQISLPVPVDERNPSDLHGSHKWRDLQTITRWAKRPCATSVHGQDRSHRVRGCLTCVRGVVSCLWCRVKAEPVGGTRISLPNSPLKVAMHGSRRDQSNITPLPFAPEVRCGYMGKACDRPRSLKRDGRLHRFCMYHRERANLNQRRVDARKRLRGHEQAEELSAIEYEEVKRREEELERQYESGGCWLNEQELGFLSYLLFHDATDRYDQSPVFSHRDANQMW